MASRTDDDLTTTEATSSTSAIDLTGDQTRGQTGDKTVGQPRPDGPADGSWTTDGPGPSTDGSTAPSEAPATSAPAEETTGTHTTAAIPHGEPEPLIARLGRGAITGVATGLVFLLLNVWYAASTGAGASQPLELISTLALGGDALPGDANALLGFVIHVGVSALLGMGFGLLAPLFRNNGAIALAGGLYGMTIFVINFLVLANTLLPQFQGPNLAVELMAHVVFGHLLALGFYSTGVRSHLRRMPVAGGSGLRGER